MKRGGGRLLGVARCLGVGRGGVLWCGPGLEIRLRFLLRLLAVMRFLLRRKRRAGLRERRLRLAATRGLRGKIPRFLLGLGLVATLGRLFRGVVRLGQRWRRCAAAKFRNGLSLRGRRRLVAHASAELGKKTLLRGGRRLGFGAWWLRGSGTAFAMLLLGLGFEVRAMLGPGVGGLFLAVVGIGAAAPRSVHLNVRCKVLPCEVKI